MNNSLVSILIPTYNAEKTIKRTIESVLNQTYSNFLLIIVDDKSKDNTVKIIESFKDSRITLYKNETNLGFESNWNKVLSKAVGDYVKLLPDDDTLSIDALELQIKVFEKYKNVILVGSRRNIVDEEDNILLTRGKKLGKKPLCKYKDAIKNIIRYGTNPIGEPGSTLFRISVLKKVPNFNGQYIHFIDLDFYTRVLKYGDYFFIDKVLSNFRVWNRSYSVLEKNNNFKESINFFEKIKKENTFLSSFDIFICKINIYKNKYLKYLFYFFITKYKS